MNQASSTTSSEIPLGKVQPDERYITPENLLAATDLSKQEKQTLLTQWATDLDGKLRASDENMASQTVETTGEMLRRVKVAQQLLETAADANL